MSIKKFNRIRKQQIHGVGLEKQVQIKVSQDLDQFVQKLNPRNFFRKSRGPVSRNLSRSMKYTTPNEIGGKEMSPEDGTKTTAKLQEWSKIDLAQL